MNLYYLLHDPQSLEHYDPLFPTVKQLEIDKYWRAF